MSASGTADLTRARARLAELDTERAALRNTIAKLEREGVGPDVTTAAGRVELFASLFRGRPDVFATRWESTRNPGRSGWAPKCSNEWKAGVCAKPEVRCAACASRRFVPFSAAEVRLHLEGRQTAGIYPLLPDKTCWLVAIDLDGQTWREDVVALRSVADELEVPVLLERSRSGRGAHVWVLFSAPVPARSARALGSMLLTRAMGRRAISMSSYDRLFPNQNTMPAGGFGNLIALPLQRARRSVGCTVFLDDRLEPLEDQWVHLAQARRVARERVEMLAGEAETDGGSLRMTPWPDGSHSRPVRPLVASGPPVGDVTLRLAGRIEVPCAMLPADLQDRLRRMAAFANPEFFERERARLSTHKTPRVIACHEQTNDALLLPRGCLDRVGEELAASGISIRLDDERADGSTVSVTFNGTLTPPQQAAVNSLAAHEIGVLVAPPGAGKTVMGAALIARHARSALVLVHRRPLLEQWTSRLTHFLGIEPGTIGSSQPRPSASGVDVAMIQSLIRCQDIDLSCYGHVLVDECHHVPAVSVERLLRQIPARRIVGLTATPNDETVVTRSSRCSAVPSVTR